MNVCRVSYQKGQMPERDSAYHRYKMLEEMFRAYEA